MIKISPIDSSFIELHVEKIRAEKMLQRDLKELEKELHINKNKHGKAVCKFVRRYLIESSIANLEEMEILQQKFINVVTKHFNCYKNNVEDYLEFHNRLEVIFTNAYNRFGNIINNDKFIEEDLYKSWNAYKYIQKLNISVCPYCNIQPIHIIQSEFNLHRTGKSARPALDHFIPKSIYPIFAVALFNLVPACTYCNSGFKKNFISSFKNIYSPFEEEIENAFSFEIVSKKKMIDSFKELRLIGFHQFSESEINYLKLINEYDEPNRQFIKWKKSLLEALEKAYKTRVIKKLLENRENVFDKQLDTKMRGYIDNIDKSTKQYIEMVDQYCENRLNIYTLHDEMFYIYRFSKHYINLFLDLLPASKQGKKTIEENLKKLLKIKTKILNSMFKRDFINTDLLQKEQLLHHSLKENEDFNFVDVYSGKSQEYAIRIKPNSTITDKMLKQKVLYNVNVFQLEAAYRSVQPYVSEKFELHYKINKEYLQGLKEQFPRLIEELNTSLFYEETNYSNRILGKITYELIRPL